jgi:hypothetical protein
MWYNTLGVERQISQIEQIMPKCRSTSLGASDHLSGLFRFSRSFLPFRSHAPDAQHDASHAWSALMHDEGATKPTLSKLSPHHAWSHLRSRE